MRRYALRDDQSIGDQGFSAWSRPTCRRHGRRTIDCSAEKLLCTAIERAFPGAICLSVSATGRSSTSALIGGRRAAFSSAFSGFWRAITTTKYMMIDAYWGAGASAQRPRTKKNGEQAIGRSRGGLTTKIHALVDALGNPANLMLTPGQIHDLACADLIENAVRKP